MYSNRVSLDSRISPADAEKNEGTSPAAMKMMKESRSDRRKEIESCWKTTGKQLQSCSANTIVRKDNRKKKK
jgi:hypothetical protein